MIRQTSDLSSFPFPPKLLLHRANAANDANGNGDEDEAFDDHHGEHCQHTHKIYTFLKNQEIGKKCLVELTTGTLQSKIIQRNQFSKKNALIKIEKRRNLKSDNCFFYQQKKIPANVNVFVCADDCADV